jgi:hypothetical protein
MITAAVRIGKECITEATRLGYMISTLRDMRTYSVGIEIWKQFTSEYLETTAEETCSAEHNKEHFSNHNYVDAAPPIPECLNMSEDTQRILGASKFTKYRRLLNYK